MILQQYCRGTKCNIHILWNIHDGPIAGNFYNTKKKAMKPWIVMDYSSHKGYMDKGDRMANSYSICHHILKWTEKLLFSLLDLAILNSCILFSLCGCTKISHKDFRFALVRNMVAQADMNGVDRSDNRWPSPATQISRLIPCAKQIRFVCLARGD